MKFDEVTWREQFVDKIIRKHQVHPSEVEEMFQRRPLVRRQERGRRRGQDLYAAYGQTDAGRYIVAFIIRKAPRVALPISARDMRPKERAYYEAHRARQIAKAGRKD